MGLVNGLFEIGKGLGKATFDIGKGTLKEGIHLGKSTPGFLGSNVGKIAMAAGVGAAIGGMSTDESVGDNLGDRTKKGLIGGALVGASGIGAGAIGIAGAGALAASGTVLTNVYGLGTKAIKMPAGGISKISDLKFSGLGKGLLVGAAALESVRSAEQAFYKSRMGQSDGMVRTATPMIPNYSQQQGQSYGPAYGRHAGATGDLVFALNNLKHG